MYAYAYDRGLGTMVGMLARPFNEEEDNRKLLESIAKHHADALSPSAVGAFILVVDPSYPNPNAGWRKRFAEARDGVRFTKELFAVVTQAPHLRGVLTAVNWMRPPSLRFEAESFVTFDEAARWVEEKRAQKLPTLKRLSDDVHDKLGFATSSGQGGAGSPRGSRPRLAKHPG